MGRDTSFQGGVYMSNEREALMATTSEWKDSASRSERLAGAYSLCGLLLIPALVIPSASFASRFTEGLALYLLAATIMVAVAAPLVYVMWRDGRTQQTETIWLMGALETQLTDALDGATRSAASRVTQARRQEFETRLANALEMAEGESEVIEVVERAFASTLPATPAELLLADNSHAHLSRMAVSTAADAHMCSVDSPNHCPAARRAQVQRFEDSDALDACPKLRDRPQGRLSAMCVPVSIMGRTVGVIHATAEYSATFEDEAVGDVATLANLAGARLGLLRMVADTQLQAATDSLTGLLNRRSLENKVRALGEGNVPYTVVMADLDHFKQLNDTHGHETGDRALRLFARTLKSSLRGNDLICRHGGEEFAIVLTRCSVQNAFSMLTSVRAAMAEAITGAGIPTLTVSFGVVEALVTEELATALARADAALFEAKRTGRDRIVIHDSAGQTVSASPDPRSHTADGSLSQQELESAPSETSSTRIRPAVEVGLGTSTTMRLLPLTGTDSSEG